MTVKRLYIWFYKIFGPILPQRCWFVTFTAVQEGQRVFGSMIYRSQYPVCLGHLIEDLEKDTKGAKDLQLMNVSRISSLEAECYYKWSMNRIEKEEQQEKLAALRGDK